MKLSFLWQIRAVLSEAGLELRYLCGNLFSVGPEPSTRQRIECGGREGQEVGEGARVAAGGGVWSKDLRLLLLI